MIAGRPDSAPTVHSRKWPRRVNARFIPPLVAVMLLLLALTPTGCYLSRAGWEEAKILGRRKPIAKVVADSATDAATRAKLRLVVEARDYARHTLGLDVEESFTTYSRLDRDTLVLLVSAAHRDRLQSYTWWFPIVGRVPYKGFFDFGAARALGATLQREGFDVYLRPASAFSTLGWFNDPLLSTTLKGSDSLDLVNTVIHEVTHNSYYGAGRAAFNESFANFVGARGAEAFFRAKGDSSAAAEVVRRWDDEKLLGVFWGELYNTLDSSFSAHPESREARLAVRDTVYAQARRDLMALAPQLTTVSPRYAERAILDNAALLARRVYLTDVAVFDEAYRREGMDLRRTIARIIEVAKGTKGDPFVALREWVEKDAPPVPPS